MKIEIIENNKTFVLDVVIDGVNFGIFDMIDNGKYSYFPKRNEQITGAHLIEIGHELNKLNGACEHGVGEEKICSQCFEDAEYEDMYGDNK